MSVLVSGRSDGGTTTPGGGFSLRGLGWRLGVGFFAGAAAARASVDIGELQDAASARIAAAKKDFYPNINLAAFIGQQSLGFGHFLEAGSQARGITPAEELLTKFHGNWKESVDPIYSEYAY